VFTEPLHSNGRGTDHIENSLSVVDCLPSRCFATLWPSTLQDITGRWLLIGSRQGYGNKRQWPISSLYPGIHLRLFILKLFKDAVSFFSSRDYG
jgi:hypothetical protein